MNCRNCGQGLSRKQVGVELDSTRITLVQCPECWSWTEDTPTTG